jgi:hypothetical protein
MYDHMTFQMYVCHMTTHLTQAAILMAYQPISRSGLCADVGEMLARCEPAYWCLTRVDNVSDWDD